MTEWKTYTVGMLRYSDCVERKRKITAESEAKAIRLLHAATWKFGYNEYWIVEEEQ